MQFLLEGASLEERKRYVDELGAHGLTVAVDAEAQDGIVVSLLDDTIVVRWSAADPPTRLSRAVSPTDLSAFLRVLTELTDLRHRVRIAEGADAGGLAASILVHDANNALAPMILAAEQLVAMDAAPVTELAGTIAEGCRRLSAQMRHLLAMTRGARPHPISVNIVVANLASTLRMLAGHEVQLTTRLEDPLPPVVVDPLGLESVILNLVANARDAMRNGGDILLSTSSVRVMAGDASGVPEGRWVLMEVRDQGCGMDSATLARAFDPFFTTKPVGRGAGLGLASVKRAVGAASGEVRIHSQVGEGTVVQVWFPESMSR
jgi:signal transduction histidine kinase